MRRVRGGGSRWRNTTPSNPTSVAPVHLFPASPLLSHPPARPVKVQACTEVPDFLPSDWSESHKERPMGPRLDLTAEEAIKYQLEALRNNDEPCQDHGIEVMYRFTDFDPFERSKYFGRAFDLGQFERFRRIFHHGSFRVLINHKKITVLSSLYVKEDVLKQRVKVEGVRPGEEETFEFTMVQRVGGCWDGYWLTESLHHDGGNTFNDDLAVEHVPL